MVLGMSTFYVSRSLSVPPFRFALCRAFRRASDAMRWAGKASAFGHWPSWAAGGVPAFSLHTNTPVSTGPNGPSCRSAGSIFRRSVAQDCVAGEAEQTRTDLQAHPRHRHRRVPLVSTPSNTSVWEGDSGVQQTFPKWWWISRQVFYNLGSINFNDGKHFPVLVCGVPVPLGKCRVPSVPFHRGSVGLGHALEIWFSESTPHTHTQTHIHITTCTLFALSCVRGKRRRKIVYRQSCFF